MKGRRALVWTLGLAAVGLAAAVPFLPPVRARIAEEWCLLKLDSPDRIERRLAAERLAELGSTRAIPRIAALFPADSYDPPHWVPQVLLRMGPAGVEAAFGLRSPGSRIHPSVSQAIAALGPAASGAIPALAAQLTSDKDGLDAAFALRSIGPAGIQPLLDALAHSGVAGRLNAAAALGFAEAEAGSVLPALGAALEDAQEEVRKAAARALGGSGPLAREAVPALALRLRDEARGVREESARALGQIGPEAREAIPALVEALDPEEGAGYEAAQALAAIDLDGEAVAPLLLRRLSALPRGEPEQGWSLFWALRLFAARSPEVVRALLESTHHEDPHVRIQAVQALTGRTGDPVRRRLLELLSDGERNVRLKAACALAETKADPEEVLPVLMEALREGDGSDRSRAAYHLKQLGPRAAAPRSPSSSPRSSKAAGRSAGRPRGPSHPPGRPSRTTPRRWRPSSRRRRSTCA